LVVSSGISGEIVSAVVVIGERGWCATVGGEIDYYATGDVGARLLVVQERSGSLSVGECRPVRAGD
jgi:hypothetical protein